MKEICFIILRAIRSGEERLTANANGTCLEKQGATPSSQASHGRVRVREEEEREGKSDNFIQ